MDVIELQQVTKTFGNLTAVDNLSLSVEHGKYVTMLGPSGCGKTTTLRMIGGFEYPDRGRILLDGEDITDFPPHTRKLNVMFQDFALFPHMTVEENIGYGLRFGEGRKLDAASELKKALDMIQLGHKARSKPHELSVGQRQRVALARALVRHPKVLLLDEPLSALDAELRATMQIELRELQQRADLTFLMVTHDQAEALVMSDEIIVMKDGVVVESGSPEDLYNHPATPYVASFLGASNLVPGRIESAAGATLRIAFGDASLEVTANGRSAEVGRPVTMSIRPERIGLHRREVTTSSFSGRVTESFYRGEAMQILVDVGAKAPLSLIAPLSWKGARGEIPQVGERIELHVDPDSVVLFDGHVDASGEV